jgi:hypothetical protein
VSVAFALAALALLVHRRPAQLRRDAAPLSRYEVPTRHLPASHPYNHSSAS